MKRIVLIGAGGHGRVVADIAAMLGYDVLGFLDQNWPELKNNGPWPVTGRADKAGFAETVQAGGEVFVSIGDNRLRQQVSKLLGGTKLPGLVHPSAVISPNATIAEGTVVVAGTVVNAFAAIGAGVILNTGCTIDHDCLIGDFVHVSPGANLAGKVTIGARSWVGIGAVVKEGIV